VLLVGGQDAFKRIKYLTAIHLVLIGGIVHRGTALTPFQYAEPHRLIEVNLGEDVSTADRYRNTRASIPGFAAPLALTPARSAARYRFYESAVCGMKYDCGTSSDLLRYFLSTRPPVPVRWRRRMPGFRSGSATDAGHLFVADRAGVFSIRPLSRLAPMRAP